MQFFFGISTVSRLDMTSPLLPITQVDILFKARAFSCLSVIPNMPSLLCGGEDWRCQKYLYNSLYNAILTDV